MYISNLHDPPVAKPPVYFILSGHDAIDENTNADVPALDGAGVSILR